MICMLHPYFHALTSVDPYTFPHVLPYPSFHFCANPYVALDGHYDYYESMDGVEISHFNASALVRFFEIIGPLPLENSLEEFSSSRLFSSFPEASDYPSKSGTSFSTG